ncbi:uncharacterized protein [Argopecten irradians]|uniref:uncharacterized protein n=1 Tax=Argopecten irradians TaxID=31199 RepID=UPI003714BEEE
MLRDSADDKVREARVVTQTEKKWDAKQALKEAEARLRHGDIVGSVTSRRLGLGTITRPRWGSANHRTRRDMAPAEIRSMDEEARQVNAVSMRQQGSWTHWEGVRQREETSNLAHVLTSCQVALSDGRYTWRHDQVLKEVAASLDRARRKKRTISKGPKSVTFVKSGTRATGSVDASGILATARDWEMRADIQQKMDFPAEVASTPFRSDVVLWSRSSKQVVLVELTSTMGR